MFPTAKLGRLATKVGSGATPRGGASVYTDDGVAFIRSQNVLDFRMKLDDVAHLTDDAAHALRGVTVEPDDVLLNITGDSIARCCVVEAVALPARVSQHVAIIRTTKDLHSKFLQYALLEPAFKRHLIAISDGGGTRKALTKAMIEGLDIPLPLLAEQQAIAEVLGALDDKIAVNARVVRLADGLAESLLLRQVSHGTVKLAEIAEVTMGSSPPGSSYNEHGHGVPFYQGVRDFGTRFPSRRVWTDQPVRMASAKETLLSVRAPVGRTNLASEEMCIGRGLAALRSRTAHPMTLFHQVRAAHSAWAPYEAEGTVFGAISRPQLEGIDVPAVDRLVAADLEDRLAELENVVATCLRESAILAATRDELLPLLMSGKVRVMDAEKTLEGVL